MPFEAEDLLLLLLDEPVLVVRLARRLPELCVLILEVLLVVVRLVVVCRDEESCMLELLASKSTSNSPHELAEQSSSGSGMTSPRRESLEQQE